MNGWKQNFDRVQVTQTHHCRIILCLWNEWMHFNHVKSTSYIVLCTPVKRRTWYYIVWLWSLELLILTKINRISCFGPNIITQYKIHVYTSASGLMLLSLSLSLPLSLSFYLHFNFLWYSIQRTILILFLRRFLL